MTKKIDINNKKHSRLPEKFRAGGDSKDWHTKKVKAQTEKQKLPNVGNIMEEFKQALKTIKRTEFPIFLDPKTASFIQVAIHAKIRQYLSDSTIEKNIRYAKFMETHPMPVDFRNLTPEQFLRHIDYRLELENPPATPNALKHEKKAVLMFLRAYNIYDETWKKLVKTPPVIENSDNIEVPFPSVLNKLYHAKYSNDKYENVLLQTIVFVGFNYGMRPPSELCNLNTDDVVINQDGTGYVRIHEDKKRGKDRLIYPFNKSVLSSLVYKTPRNYIENWRWKKANEQSGNALFLMPNGKRITKNYLRDHITPIAKKIAGDRFHLYTMRHTCASYLYEYVGELEVVRNRLGHRKISTTMKYVHIADCIKRQVGKRNLFNQALRHIHGGKPEKIDCWPKNGQSNSFSPRKDHGPGRI